MASSFTPSKILIFGGTGTIGRFITSALLTSSASSYPFPKPQIYLFTSPASATSKAGLLSDWTAQGLAGVIAGDLSSEADVTSALRDHAIDTVISAVGRGGLHHQLQLLRLAETASDTVRWFLPSEYGTDVEHNAKSSGEKTHQVKLQVRRYAREHLRRVKVTYVVTGPYFDMWVNAIPGLERAGGFVPAKREAYVIEDGKGKVGFCTMEDVGKFVAATIAHPSVASDKALKVQSFVVSPNEVLTEYEKQTGGDAKWTVTKTPLDELRALETQAWESASPAGAVLTLRRIWAEGGTLYEKNDNELLELGPADLDSLEVAVKRVLAAAAAK